MQRWTIWVVVAVCAIPVAAVVVFLVTERVRGARRRVLWADRHMASHDNEPTEDDAQGAVASAGSETQQRTAQNADDEPDGLEADDGNDHRGRAARSTAWAGGQARTAAVKTRQTAATAAAKTRQAAATGAAKTRQAAATGTAKTRQAATVSAVHTRRAAATGAAYTKKHANKKNAMIALDVAVSYACVYVATAVRARRAAIIAARVTPLLLSKIRSAQTLNATVTCMGCGREMMGRDMEVDHIRPHSQGGSDDLSNLQLLCTSCNRIKGVRSMDYLHERLNAIKGGERPPAR